MNLLTRASHQAGWIVGVIPAAILLAGCGSTTTTVSAQSISGYGDQAFYDGLCLPQHAEG